MKDVRSRPLVSIGMPVFNAEQYLADALRAILAQDYPDFELIISDNGSTDRTKEICLEFQKTDSRIRYIRQPKNLGASKNFAFVVHQARGEYFMWAAHDDLLHPSFIRKCMEQLGAHPEAVLCCTEINFLDADGLPHSSWSQKGYTNIETLGMTPPQRVHELIRRMGWFAIYGLMRLEAVKKISLGLGVYGADVIQLEELLLLGDFVKVPEHLFSYRLVKTKSAADYQAQSNGDSNPLPVTQTPSSDLAANLLQTVYRSQLRDEEKVEIFADFLVTLTRSNEWWRQQITAELLGSGVRLNDSQFAFFLAAMLSRSIPLETMKANPLIKALCLQPPGGADLLKAAEDFYHKPAATMEMPASEAYKEGVRFFRRRQFAEASGLFGLALQQQESSEGWHDWATARLACNQTADAVHGFRRALELNRDNRQAALKLGILLANLNRNAEAVFYLEQGVLGSQEPERAGVLQLLAKCRDKVASMSAKAISRQ